MLVAHIATGMIAYVAPGMIVDCLICPWYEFWSLMLPGEQDQAKATGPAVIYFNGSFWPFSA